LQQTVAEVRQFLDTDRVLIYRFEPDFSGVIAVESVINSALSAFGHKLNDPCLEKKHIAKYQQGEVQAIDDLSLIELSPCYQQVLSEFEAKARLVVPIVASEELWGLLIAHHCQSPRQWQSSEVNLLKQLATQVGIAVQQAELYDRVQSLNAYLEQKIDQRTASLQSSIKFETLTRKITEKIRDSLDEQQILQTVTQEIGGLLQVERCKIELYSGDRSTAKVAYEHGSLSSTCQGIIRSVDDFPELDRQLLHKQSLQFVEHAYELNLSEDLATRLICPIFDDRGVLGNIWLLRAKEEHFTTAEIVLVEQVANQCAIAIRQARLYQQSQIQVAELERLNLLKDDFLKTISHELKTPMSSIKLASETLETLLEQEIGSNKSATFTKVLNIFRSACDRQSQLVNDLLTLCYTDAQKEMQTMQWIDLSVWLPQIVEPFKERVEQQQQNLNIDLDADLPQLKSDISTIKRIINELLNNACKYTPAGETITLRATATDQEIRICVHNTGIEIPSQEQVRVFDKFYRIPNRDPWQFGGTGIGLALVKNLVESLGGKI
ncbi:MAG: GAF domain-containing sensor histidine kinase, partial [Cyanobacteria bacterium J06633_1]